MEPRGIAVVGRRRGVSYFGFLFSAPDALLDSSPFSSDTWISCEETKGGKNYQVDPMGRIGASPITLGREGGNWESFAFDISDPKTPRFFVTEDAAKGALQVSVSAPSTCLVTCTLRLLILLLLA